MKIEMFEPVAAHRACPFCGSSRCGLVEERVIFYVSCSNCGARSATCGTPLAAWHWWNLRSEAIDDRRVAPQAGQSGAQSASEAVGEGRVVVDPPIASPAPRVHVRNQIPLLETRDFPQVSRKAF